MHTYKPYKQKASEWSSDPEKARAAANGREMMYVGIGSCIHHDDNTTEEIFEYIYRDILLGIFKNDKSYKLKMTLGHTPNIVITYDGLLVIHNDILLKEVEKIKEAILTLPKELIANCIANSVLNQMGLEKTSDELKQTTKKINQICNADYPAEFIACIMKEYMCDELRELENEKQEELYFKTYEELVSEAALVLISDDKDIKKQEYDVLREIGYRFIQGLITQK